MPRGDRTGPRGLGPMTGRAAGYCAGYPVPGYMNPTPGYGRGYGRGWGRGYRGGLGRGFGRGLGRLWWDYPPQYPLSYSPARYAYPPRGYSPMYPPAPQSPEQELATLEDYKKALEAEKEDLKQHINEVLDRIKELEKTIQPEGRQSQGL